MAGRKAPRRRIGRAQVDDFVSGLYEGDVHAKRVASLANGVDGASCAASVGVRAMRQGLRAHFRRIIRQFDRLLSNTGPAT